MSDLKAVMDLGTNTFHLLIVEVKGSKYKELIHEHVHVRIGEGGINKGLIQPEAFERGLKTMQRFGELLQTYNVQQVRAIATSALRNAANGGDFVNEVKAKTSIGIEVIDGSTEASFIYKGIRAGNCLSVVNSLILDIGGGSAEFIICNEKQIIWKQSFEIGAARLMDKFQAVDPIPQEAIEGLFDYLQGQLAGLFNAAKKHPIDNLIGSSGVFESYAELTENVNGDSFDIKKLNNYNFEKQSLLNLIDDIVKSNHDERAANPAIIAIRVDMIVVASLLTRFVIENLNIKNVLMSTNSLKEGVLAEMIS